MKETRTKLLFSISCFLRIEFIFTIYFCAGSVCGVYSNVEGLPREKTWSIEEKSQGETRLSHSTPTTTCVITENPDIQRRQIYRKVGDCKIYLA
jgi:hypothetical protein